MSTKDLITLRLPTEVTIPGSMPNQVLVDTLWTLNLGIQTTNGDTYTVVPIQQKPVSCSKCTGKAVFKQGKLFFCAAHYRDALLDKITNSFDNSLAAMKK